MYMSYTVQQAQGSSSPQAVSLCGSHGKKNQKENKPELAGLLCYPISADAAPARGRHIPGITK